MLSFSGTNYLGINRNAAFQKLVEEGISKYGLHYGGSRFSNLCPDIFEQAEVLLSELSGAEAALIVSSGTIAGHLATSQIASSDIYIVQGTHPSLINNLNTIQFLNKDIAQQFEESATILCNSIDPLYCQEQDFYFIEKLNRTAQIIIDDSHGIGLNGLSGGGIFSILKDSVQSKMIVTASLGKAFGIPGGVILSDSNTINQLKQSPTFAGAAPPPAAYLYAFIKGQEIYHAAREKLQSNIRLFKEHTEALDLFKSLNQYPVFYTPDNDLAGYLLKQDVAISSFRYPSQQSDLITRVVINSNHRKEDIQHLIQLLKRYATPL